MSKPTTCENCHKRIATIYIVDGCDGSTADWCDECLHEHEDIVGEWNPIVTEPTTPTGKALLAKARNGENAAIYLAGLGSDDIIAIEQEAAAAERERIGRLVDGLPEHRGTRCVPSATYYWTYDIGTAISDPDAVVLASEAPSDD